MLKSLARSYLLALRELAPYGCALATLIAIAGLAPTTSAFLAAGLALFAGLTAYVLLDALADVLGALFEGDDTQAPQNFVSTPMEPLVFPTFEEINEMFRRQYGEIYGEQALSEIGTVSVTDRLPESKGRYLAWIDDEQVHEFRVLYFNPEGHYLWYSPYNGRPWKVTYWTTLPAKPTDVL